MVDARLLVIATDGQEQELAAVEDALQFMGSPYDKMIATSAAPLTAALQAYEAQFHVREASLYLLPDGTEGLGVATQQNTTTTPLAASCTEDGREVFFDVNCGAPVQ